MGNKTNLNESIALSLLNFEELDNKINSKLSFWTGSGISLKGKIRVVNTFVLPEICYRLECVDITKEIKVSIERKVKHFLWNDRCVGRISLPVLMLNYESGGMNLLDIENKVQVLRIKWLLTLIDHSNKIERHIVDNLIGSYRDVKGLKILNHDIEINKFRGIDTFYANVIRHWISVGIVFEGATVRSIKNEIIYHNPLLVDQHNNNFKYLNALNCQSIIPKYFKDLPVSRALMSISNTNREIIRNMNRAYWNLCNNNLGKYEKNCYSINLGSEIKKKRGQ